jgi:hypothetical protein
LRHRRDRQRVLAHQEPRLTRPRPSSRRRAVGGMGFRGIGKSLPDDLMRAGGRSGSRPQPAPGPIGISLQPAIPRRVAPQQSPLPLHRPPTRLSARRCRRRCRLPPAAAPAQTPPRHSLPERFTRPKGLASGVLLDADGGPFGRRLTARGPSQFGPGGLIGPRRERQEPTGRDRLPHFPSL